MSYNTELTLFYRSVKTASEQDEAAESDEKEEGLRNRKIFNIVRVVLALVLIATIVAIFASGGDRSVPDFEKILLCNAFL